MAFPSNTTSELKDYPFLQLRNISLRIDGHSILNAVNMSCYHSSIHALVGDMGSGKSSIARIISGVSRFDNGEILIDERIVNRYTTDVARKNGIYLVTRENLNYLKTSVAEVLVLDSPLDGGFFLSRNGVLNKARALLRDLNLPIDPETPMRELNELEKSIVILLHYLLLKPRLLVLDEIFTQISASSIKTFSRLIEKEKRAGMSVLYITHTADELLQLADFVSILRRGSLLLTEPVNKIDEASVIKLAYSQAAQQEDRITDKKEFYQLLRYNRAILERLPLNIIVTDTTNQVKLVNEATSAFFNIHADELFNHPLIDLFGERNDLLLVKINEALGENIANRLFNVELVINDEPRTCNITMYPIFEGLSSIGNIIIIEDITEQEQLRERAYLADNLASLGLLASGVAHEINNPLEVLFNKIDYFKAMEADTTHIQYLNDIEEELEAIAYITGNLLSYSRDSNRELESVDLNELISSILKLVYHHAANNRIRLIFLPSADRISLEANRTELKQIVLNLVRNSFEAMGAGGELELATEVAEEGGQSTAVIRTRDTGTGITAKNPGDIFLPFYSTKKGTSKNVGLGLYTAYMLVKKYHGGIRVENLFPCGCRFTVTLPIARRQPAAP